MAGAPGGAARALGLAAGVLAVGREDLPDDGDGVALELWHAAQAPPPGAVPPWPGLVVTHLLAIAGALPPAVAAAGPHLLGHRAYAPAGLDAPAVAEVLRGAVEVVARRGGGTSGVVLRTGVQVGGVLDDLDAAAARRRPLGATWADGRPDLAVWAPTAQRVTLLLAVDGVDAPPRRVPMDRGDDGAWSCRGEPSWAGLAYRYEVAVHVPAAGGVVVAEVTDPYAVALTVDSTHAVLLDLADPALAPSLWVGTPQPRVSRPTARTIYELHVRDFSATDPTVPPERQGTYLAFAGEGDGVAHLRGLAAAGLTSVHLLPVFDFTTVPEDRARRAAPPGDLDRYPPDSAEQQAAVEAVAARDAFNWGYDPWHWMAPEGSYATAGHQHGGDRVVELRTMVGALHAMGLQVVLDQVFNHTAADGQDPRSVLDRIVPGYYHRLDAGGDVARSTCCANVATERAMAERLMVDAVVLWARHHKVDGFRFDLMGHHSRDTMLAVRAALDALTPEVDGVDGRAVHLYGEGWSFGEVDGDRLFVQARQGTLGGTGIATFSDRLRDAVRGGSPVFPGTFTHQGWGSGLGLEPNGATPGSPAEQLADLAHATDLVRLGLAGNLRSYTFRTAQGRDQRGDEIVYEGVPAGYADSPDEVVTYVDAHDNHTLYDALALKLPVETPTADRVRAVLVCLAATALAQTPVLWHAGTELLRSKSLDADSYDSGDWFNAVDWTGRRHGFGRGLPPARHNAAEWDLYRPLLAEPRLRPSPEHVALARAMALDLLRLRAATPLLHLGDPGLIRAKLTFPGSGPAATPGVVLLHVDDRVGPDVDPALDGLLAVLNPRPWPVVEQVPGLAGRAYALAPAQRDGADDVVRATTWEAATGTVRVPARTAAVLVEPA